MRPRACAGCRSASGASRPTMPLATFKALSSAMPCDSDRDLRQSLTAVDDDRLPRDEARAVRREEQRGVGDVLGLAERAQRDVLDHRVDGLLAEVGEPFGADAAGLDPID